MTLREQLLKYAKSDLDKARKQCIVVADTEKGNLSISYDGSYYIIARFNLPDISYDQPSLEVLYYGKRAGAVQFLCNVYQVVVV